ncbi:MAG: cupin [Planctomycetota bacterium]|nr:MAG: cupin [Planctomycetota bacterium]
MRANLFADIPGVLAEERFDTLVEGSAFRLERIVSTGQATPPGEWLVQSRAEWVAVLAGSAAVRFEDERDESELRPGDWLYIAANRRHRVEWTDVERPTVWLALHFDAADATP